MTTFKLRDAEKQENVIEFWLEVDDHSVILLGKEADNPISFKSILQISEDGLYLFSSANLPGLPFHLDGKIKLDTTEEV